MKTHVSWLAFDDEGTRLWTLGWLPDSPTLRYSLGSALRTEGVVETLQEARVASDHAQFEHGWLGVDDFGDYVYERSYEDLPPGEIIGAATIAWVK